MTEGSAPWLVEAIFEVRFEPENREVADVLLPALMYAGLRTEYPDIETLPAARIPATTRTGDENLKYLPTHWLKGAGRIVQVGPHVVNVVQHRPYRGWSAFKADISRALAVMGKQQPVPLKPSRFSLKYVNVLEGDEGRQLDLLTVGVTLMGKKAPEHGFTLRTEFRLDGGRVSVVTIRPNTVARSPGGEEQRGVLVELDVVVPCEDLVSVEQRLDEAHAEVLAKFKGLLTSDTAKRLHVEG